eukprot:c20243_g1_i3 orf=288-2612(+)
MDAYSIHGDHYYQGYSGQAPPPGTAPVQAPPPGTGPTQPSAPTTAPLAPPGVAPAPSSTPAVYYGAYPTPSYGYPPSADRWSSHPMPAAEPHPYPSYPPNTLPYDRPAYSHHPYYQEPLPYAQSYPGPQQAYMPLPPRGSDVTHFRKKRPFVPPQNPRSKNKPFKQSQQNFRGGGGKNAQQGKRAFNADPRPFSAPFNGNPMVNNAQLLHPFWHSRIDEAPANRPGKKRRMEERGEGRHGRHGDRRKGDKRARPSWNKGKRKKGRNSGGEKRNMDPNDVAVGNSSAEKGENRKFDGVLMTDEQAREEAAWLELHRDARKRVQEFLHTSSEKQSSQKAGMQDTLEARGGDANVEMQEANGEVVENAVAARPDGVDTPQVGHIDASQGDHINALHPVHTEGQQSDHTYAVQSDRADLLVLNAHIDVVKAGCADLLTSDSFHSDDVNMKQLDMVDIQKSDCGDAPLLATEIVKDLETDGLQEAAGVDEVKGENKKHKSLAELVESAQNSEKKHGKREETPRQDELKEREEKSFKFFTKLLEENKDLRNMYIEKSNSGAFECLMCHSKMKKKFSNLVSLVTHASNVLKTKKLPEHRGYSRAVCSLFGWDPYRIPKVPKAKASVESALGDEEIAPVGDTGVHAPIGDAVEPDTVGDTAEEAVTGDTEEVAPVDDADVSKLRGDADESAPKDDADECTPKRDADSSVEQDFIKDAEKPVDKDVMMEEPSQEGNEQAMFAEDGEALNKHTDGGNELVEQAEVTDTAKLLQAGSEVIYDLVA